MHITAHAIVLMIAGCQMVMKSPEFLGRASRVNYSQKLGQRDILENMMSV